MPFFSHPEFDDHEEVVFCHYAASGLDAIIAIHNSSRGPALGGCRMWAYGGEDEALTDVLRLSRGMTYKSALAGLDYGGGKSVIIGDPWAIKSEALFRAMGRFVDSLGGRYIAAEDVGIQVADVEIMARETEHVAGIPARSAGDPSPATAFGVYVGIRAALKHKLGDDDLAGVGVAVQGLGHVGFHLCRHLAGSGAVLTVADIDPAAVARAVEAFGARPVAPDAIIGVEAEVFAPCALGAVIDETSLDRLQAKIVAGSANNQLAAAAQGPALARRGVLYAPDYVINAGGIIYISHEGPTFERAKAMAHVGRIHDTLIAIFERAEAAGICTAEAADRLAEERFKSPLAHAPAAA